MNTEYRCVTCVEDIREYLAGHTIVAFDIETAPNPPFRNEEKAALDPAKAHIVGCSFSIAPYTGIYVPISHLAGTNINPADFFSFFREFLTDRTITKVAHNIAFEASFAYALGIVIQTPVYDTICAAQMTLKTPTEFRKLADSGLKHLADALFHEPLPTFSSVTDGHHFD